MRHQSLNSRQAAAAASSTEGFAIKHKETTFLWGPMLRAISAWQFMLTFRLHVCVQIIHCCPVDVFSKVHINRKAISIYERRCWNRHRISKGWKLSDVSSSDESVSLEAPDEFIFMHGKTSWKILPMRHKNFVPFSWKLEQAAIIFTRYYCATSFITKITKPYICSLPLLFRYYEYFLCKVSFCKTTC